MKMKGTLFLTIMITTAQQTITTPKPTTTTTWTTIRPTTPWTTGRPAVNLNGLMATLSGRGKGISFYPPNYSPDPPYTTTFPYYTTTAAPWTAPPLTRGLSVCLRYLTDWQLFLTLSPERRGRVTLIGGTDVYKLFYGGSRLDLIPSIKILPDVAPDIWTRICLTLDFKKKVAQVFRDSNMSIRKRLLDAYSWQSEPVIQFSDFAGQVTDVQMWDYPLNYREIADYMNGGVYRLYRGSVLTWSYISYSNSGDMLLEEVYEIKAKLPIRERGRRLGGGKKSSGRGFNMRQSKRQQL